tara:strand:- start:619 stop:1188 length:570 start_codon:yes stop_codon:yes gene_type:complete
VFKERLQEILEFTKSESPYSKANKGWINQDIFLEFGKSSSNLSKQKESAKVTLLWPPIQRLISNLLLIIIISSLIVITSLKESQLNFNLRSFTFALKNKLVQVDTKKLNLVFEEQNVDNDFNSETEEDFPKQLGNLSNYQLSEDEDLLKLEDNIAKDKLIELEEQNIEELEIKKDKSITSVKKSKSNFL